MAITNFDGKLKANEIYGSIFNQIISLQVFADNLSGGMYGQLVDQARVDGSMYGDQKQYFATDVGKSLPWGNDAEAANLLKLYRPDDPKCQVIVLNIFRQIAMTVDNYLTKRAWGDEGAFSQFNSVMLGWIRETKRVYDITTYNAYIGTVKAEKATENIQIDLTTPVGDATGEAKNRIEGETIAFEIAKLMNSLKDISRDYNEYGFLRSYEPSDLLYIWNSDQVAKIEKVSLPTIYHDQIVEKLGQYVLPARYFGTVNAVETAGKADGTIRSLVEQDIAVGGVTKHYFAGDAIIDTTYKAPAGTSYTVDPKILFKVFHRGSVPYMSAFEVGTSFFNPKSLTETHYLTWGHNTLQYLYNYPCITVKRD